MSCNDVTSYFRYAAMCTRMQHKTGSVATDSNISDTRSPPMASRMTRAAIVKLSGAAFRTTPPIGELLVSLAASLGRRGWKMFYAALCDMVMYLHKDERSYKNGSAVNPINNTIHVHHSLATRAVNYVKKQHVFRLQTADWSQFLFQTRYHLLVYCRREDISSVVF